MSYESVKKSKSKKVERNEDLSKNHSKSIRYRLRVQQETEANEEIRQYNDEQIDEQYYERD